ncbi:MAG TPA: glutamine amidotransferase, partial [Lacipirellula sp.]
SDAVFAETPTTVEGVVTAAGYANQQFKVQLLWEDADGEMEAVDTRTIRVSPNRERYPVQLTHTPAEPGEYKVSLRIESPEGELVTTNNVQSTFVTVLKGGVKVLYLAGAPRVGGSPGSEAWFVRQALRGEPDFHVTYQAIDYTQTDLDLRDELRDAKYDVYLLGGVDAMGLNARTWREMASAVEDGAGLAMLGGFHSFGPGGFLNTPLEDVLPIEMGRAERQTFGEPPAEDLHVPGPLKMLPVVQAGGVHPILRVADGANSADVWQKLPALDGANRFDRLRLKDLAEVVAEGNDPSRSPLLVLSSWGAGRTAAFAVDSTWHWQMEGFGEVHRRFWRQFVLWLAKKDESAGERVWVRLDQRRYQQGSEVQFTLGAENNEGDALPDADFNIEVQRPDGSSETVRAARRGNEAVGSFTETTSPGDYRIVVSARHSGESVGTATARFSVSDQDVELDQPAAEPMLLRSLAAMTAEAGGQALAPEELPRLLEQLKERAAEFEEEVVETITLWDRWPTFLAFVGLLSTEWFLRKRWGLV